MVFHPLGREPAPNVASPPPSTIVPARQQDSAEAPASQPDEPTPAEFASVDRPAPVQPEGALSPVLLVRGDHVLQFLPGEVSKRVGWESGVIPPAIARLPEPTSG